MTIIEALLIKILYIIFFMSILNIFRHLILFLKHMNRNELTPYKITKNERLFLGLSLSFILMCIFNEIGV